MLTPPAPDAPLPPPAPPEDLGDPGPADDEAHKASYLYEHVIDALVVFSSRYIRTALLLARRPSSAADKLLADLDRANGHYTRPMGFLAISYLVFMGLFANLTWVAQTIESGAISMRPDQPAAQSLTVPLVQLLGNLGNNVETDYLVVAILAPLPAVVLVSLASNLIANTLAAGGDYARSRFAAMVQYAVGLGLFSLVWLTVQTLLLSGTLVKLVDASAHDPQRLVIWAGAAFAVWSVLLTLVTAALILAISILPVWRTQKVLPELAALGRLRRLALSLSGPLVLASTLVGLRGMVKVADLAQPYPVTLTEARRVSALDRVVVEGALHASGSKPVAVEAWRALWRHAGDHETSCDDIAADGDSAVPPRSDVHPPRLVQLLPEAMAGDDAPLDHGTLYLDAGTSAWVRLTAPRPALDPLSTAKATPILCVRTSADPRKWIPIGN